MGSFYLLPSPLKKWCRRHLFNVVKKIDIGLVAIKTTDYLKQWNKKEMKLEFSQVLNARIQY